jgi:hypothetical protein
LDGSNQPWRNVDWVVDGGDKDDNGDDDDDDGDDINS